MSMCTSRLVRFETSCLSLSISAPLRPMMMPGRAVAMRTTSLLAARSAPNALLRFGFSDVGGDALGGGDMVLGNADENVRGALLVAERAAHRRGTQPLPARTFVDVRLAHEEPVDVERRAGIIGFALGVGDGAAKHFFNVLCGALRRVAQRLQRVLSLLPADQIDHQARLLRRHAHVPCKRVGFNRSGSAGL